MTESAQGTRSSGPGERGKADSSAVLIISPVPTHPATAGNRVRILRLVQAIDALGYRVEFAHIQREMGDVEAMVAWWGDRYHPIPYDGSVGRPRSVFSRIAKRIRNYFGKGIRVDGWYDSGSDPSLRSVLQQQDFGAVIVEYVFMSKALLNVPSDVLKVIDTHDVFSARDQRFETLGPASRWFSTSPAGEAKGLSRADTVIAIQEREAEHFRRTQSRPVVTIGDIIELPKIALESATQHAGLEVLLVGSNNPSNVQAAQWLMERVVPLVNQQLKGVQWTMVGDMVRSLQPMPSVVLEGAVDSLADFYKRAQVVVNPARVGTGLKIKTVEALSYAKPMVVSPVGGEGLEEGWQSAFRVEESAGAFANAIVDLLSDSASAQALGQEGRKFLQVMNERSIDQLAALLSKPGTETSR